MRKLLVCDFDDTFHITREGLDENMKSVEKFREAGNIFVIATGRGYYDFKHVKDAFDLKYDMLVLDHGALILDGEGNILFSDSIPADVVMRIKDDLRVEEAKRVFCTSGFEGRVSFEADNIQKINVWHDGYEKACEVLADIQKKYGDEVNAYLIPWESVEIITKNSGKDIAIKWLCNKLGIDEEDVYTAGDGYTDIKMIEKYKGYAVPNAVEPLKAVACGVVESVSELIDMIME